MYNLELWKERKKELHLTLDDIAKSTKIGISTIKDIFRGATYAPRIDTVQAIERVLGLSDDITPEERAAGWVETKKVSLTPEQDEWLTKRDEILRLYGNEGLQAVNAMIDSYIKAKK